MNMPNTVGPPITAIVPVRIPVCSQAASKAAPENAKTLIEALKNLSIIGALFMIAGYGRGPRPNEPSYADM